MIRFNQYSRGDSVHINGHVVEVVPIGSRLQKLMVIWRVGMTGKYKSRGSKTIISLVGYQL